MMSMVRDVVLAESEISSIAFPAVTTPSGSRAGESISIATSFCAGSPNAAVCADTKMGLTVNVDNVDVDVTPVQVVS
jgi:hypothetical protein